MLGRPNNRIVGSDLSFARSKGFSPLGWIPDVRGEDGKINPHLTRLYLGGNQFLSIFHVKPVYYETLAGTWRPLSEVTSHHGNKNIVFTWEGFKKVHPRYVSWLQKRCELIGGKLLVGSVALSPYLQYAHDLVTVPKLGLTVTTVYPDAHVESATVDGRLKAASVNQDWNYITRTQTTSANAPDSDASGEMAATWGHTVTDQWNELVRSMYGFDTSAIGSDTIDSGTFDLYLTSKGDIGADLSVALVSGRAGLTTSMATSDYNITNFGSTRLATDVEVASVTTSAYNTWTLNASGESHVNKSGVTVWGIMLGQDFDNTQPSWSSGAYGNVSGSYADTINETQDPKLAITHSAPAGGSFTPRAIMF